MESEFDLWGSICDVYSQTKASMCRRIDSGESTSDDIDDITDDAGEEAAVELLMAPSQRPSFMNLYTQCSRQQLASFSQNAERASIHITNVLRYQSSDDATNTQCVFLARCAPLIPDPSSAGIAQWPRSTTLMHVRTEITAPARHLGSYTDHVLIVQFN